MSISPSNSSGSALRRATVRRSAVALAVASVAAAALTGLLGSQANAATGPQTLHLIEHEETSGRVDLGHQGISAGDVFTVHSAMLNLKHKQVGRVDIVMVVTQVTRTSGSLVGTGVIHLPHGTITFASGGYEPEHVRAVITGGTGAYWGVRGEIQVKEKDDSPNADILIRYER